MSERALSGNTSNISRWTFYMLLFLAAFMPFEDFLLKFLPGPDELYFASRFISELLILVSLGWMIYHKISQGEPFFQTPVDAPMLVLIAAAVISMILNLVEPIPDLIAGIVNIRPVFRYVLLFYVIVNTPLSARQVNMIITAIVFAAFFSAMIGLAQFAAGGALDPILMPREADVEVGGEQRYSAIVVGTREIGAIHGPASDTIFYAVSMNLFFLVCLAKVRSGVFAFRYSQERLDVGDERRSIVTKNDLLVAAVLPLIILADLLTYVRASLFVILVVLAMEAFYWLGRRIALFLGAGVLMLLMLTLVLFPPTWTGGGATQREISPIEDFTSIFTVDYVINSLENQRLHHVVGVMPTVLLNNPIFGYGPNEEHVVEMIYEARPSFTYRAINEKEFKDVYWVSFLARFGLVGLLAMIAIFYVLFRSARMVYETTRILALRELSLMVMYMVIVAAIMMMLNRCYELRVFGFYFWFLPGLMFSLINHYGIARSPRRLHAPHAVQATAAP
ncbi:MAG: hypothetical protein HYR49_06760 [Gammaproteobacteria bacterium]|nr:hypothetical protein [Gammaproteobacteria bacterium]